MRRHRNGPQARVGPRRAGLAVILTLLFAAACTAPAGGGASAPASTPEAAPAASPGDSAPVTSDDYGY